jgi:uncharacterized protein (TIGR00369 family)
VKQAGGSRTRAPFTFYVSIATQENPERKRDFALARCAKWHPIASMKELPHTHSCFVCGDANAIGLNLRFETDAHLVRTRFTPRPEHIGFKQVIHGGIIATLLDEIMVWACLAQTKRFAYCAEMTVRFLNPLRPGEETIAIGELVTNRRNKLFEAKAELKDANGRIFASATGKYLPVKQMDLADMATDLVGDPSQILNPPD